MSRITEWYDERALPRLIDVICSARGLQPLRREVLARCAGTVVEIGFGSGTNLACYPDAVTKLFAVEPSARAVELASERIAASPIDIEVIRGDTPSIPLPDRSVDAAVSTYTLCTVPDPLGTLRELRRVLGPGGTLHVLEHGLAPDQRVQRVQRAYEPLHRRLAGGCHLTRTPTELVTAAGFEIVHTRSWYEGRPHSLSAMTSLVASPPPA
jgi:ubiquinone/menaquinone biosynthesis C-methylase UbiE